MEKILLIGGGGHCKSIIDTIESSELYDIVGIIDVEENIGNIINGIKIIDSDCNLHKYRNEIFNVFISIGSIGNVSIRRKIVSRLMELDFNLPIIIDKTAIISKNISIGAGTFVGKGAIINTNTQIGKNCIINSGTIIEHDCAIDDFVHIAPGSTICGGTVIAENSHIGANSTILQYKRIGKNVIVGAGSIITKDIPDDKIVYGNPGREVRL